MSNREKFKQTYAEQLKIVREKNPEKYNKAERSSQSALGRMFAAIDRNAFNKEAPAFRDTCEALGVRHTYKDIENFLGGNQ